MTQQAMTQEQALGILVQSAKVGQSKGAYSLEDAELISQAIRVFTPPAEKPEAAPAGEAKEIENKEESDPK